MQEYEIEFYDKADGSEPAKEFILALDAKMRAKVVRTVGLLREEGPSPVSYTHLTLPTKA